MQKAVAESRLCFGLLSSDMGDISQGARERQGIKSTTDRDKNRIFLVKTSAFGANLLFDNVNGGIHCQNVGMPSKSHDLPPADRRN